MARERVRFQADGADGPWLEGELWLPDGDGPVGGVVVCHPHPLRGGSMDNNVVAALCYGLNAAGLASLRFNFRGVGGSEGRYGEGVDEVADVVGALAFLAEQPGIDAERIGLAGYSFGARVSLATVPQATQIGGLLCVAPPLREPLPSASHPMCPFVVYVGDRDSNVAQGVDLYASYLPDPAQLRVVEGTDHFWRSYESILVDGAHEFFAQTLRAPGAQVAP
jgi:uncharacterized protein